jgi:hypothetical protein
MCYDLQNGITNEDLVFPTEPSLFFIDIINLQIVQKSELLMTI